MPEEQVPEAEQATENEGPKPIVTCDDGSTVYLVNHPTGQIWGKLILRFVSPNGEEETHKYVRVSSP